MSEIPEAPRVRRVLREWEPEEIDLDAARRLLDQRIRADEIGVSFFDSADASRAADSSEATLRSNAERASGSRGYVALVAAAVIVLAVLALALRPEQSTLRTADQESMAESTSAPLFSLDGCPVWAAESGVIETTAGVTVLVAATGTALAAGDLVVFVSTDDPLTHLERVGGVDAVEGSLLLALRRTPGEGGGEIPDAAAMFQEAGCAGHAVTLVVSGAATTELDDMVCRDVSAGSGWSGLVIVGSAPAPMRCAGLLPVVLIGELEQRERNAWEAAHRCPDEVDVLPADCQVPLHVIEADGDPWSSLGTPRVRQVIDAAINSAFSEVDPAEGDPSR